ncbi:MAG: exodeoxyribonuclease VII large subunit, partial [Pseudomonadales bacterium]|nr:exodeoxyribonuclease VII large subunit [Pseudomonadales bacterium]
MSHAAPPNRQVLSVSELNRSARHLLEGEFPMVFVEGEISNLARPSSGHWYFTLKDDSAQLRCAMFRNRNRMIRLPVRDGMQVIVRGRISLYEGRGEFQMVAEFLEDAGDGALRAAFEKLKAKLEAEGLFDPDRKRPIPALPKHVAVITSPTGAAIRDVLHVLARRFPAIEISVIPVQVQGEHSPKQIVDALNFANGYRDNPFDVLLLTRGGGSLEDLWSFNNEEVARAVFASEIPVVCAVGHETDFSIADFVADLRAPTPSAAAEQISPDGQDWLDTFVRHERVLTGLITSLIGEHERHLDHLGRRLRHPGRTLQDMYQRLDGLELRLHRAIDHIVERNRSRLNLAGNRLKSPPTHIDAAGV